MWIMSGEQQSNGGEGSSNNSSKMDGFDTSGRNGNAAQQQQQVLQQNAAAAAMAPMIGNINSPSVSLASVSSDGSTESYVVEPEEMFALTQEVKRLKEALSRLRKVFHTDMDRTETTKVASHERLGEVLKILRQLLEKYPLLQSNELVGSAGRLIQKVKNFDYEDENSLDPKDFHEALDALALAFSSRVSEYIMGDLESVSMSSASSNKTKSCENLTSHSGGEIGDSRDEILSGEQIDTILMRNDQGVDHALARAKVWSKYAKDVLTYVDKRTNMELDFARNLTKLAQTMRPILKEESYLPFQSIYCTGLDQDLEMCASMQATCSLLQGYKFMEPLATRRAEHEKARKALKERWQKERKRIQEAVALLLKAKAAYMQRTQEYERCRDALRIAEQGAEIGATGENKVDKRKRLEEDAAQKVVESELHYKQCVAEANERHRQLLAVKADILQQVRELILQCDQTMKAVTVAYFQLQHTLTAPVPVQFQTLCESSRLYEPGSQFMEYVKRLPEPPATDHNRFVMGEPFHFEPCSGILPPLTGLAPLAQCDETDLPVTHTTRRPNRISQESSANSDDITFGSSGNSSQRGGSGKDLGPMMAWTSSMGTIEPSDTESVESGKSSPTNAGSPMIANNNNNRKSTDVQHQAVIYFDNEPDPPSSGASTSRLSSSNSLSTSMQGTNRGPLSPTAPPRRQFMSKAAVTHRFRKLKTPSRCRECDSYVYFQGYDCQDCGLSSHKKCLETLAIQCGHKRLPRKMTTFGVDLTQHLQETSSQVPPLVCKCVHEIETRGLKFKGIYRVSSAKPKVEKLCQTFENGAELVDLTDVHPPVIANVLKLYLRQLPEPLLTCNLYRDFIRIAELCPAPGGEATISEDTAVAELRELCRRLPRSHLFTLGFLMHHLRRVACEHESNNMPASNLAIVLGPTLLWSNEGSASLATVMETPHQARVIELLSTYATDIFGSSESVIPKDYARYTSNHHHPPLRGGGEKSGATARGGKSGIRPSRSSRDSDIVSSQTERRGEIYNDEFSLPGLVAGSRESNEDIFGASVSDDDDDADPIPPFLLPDGSGKSKKSPLMARPSSPPPKIVKASLKNFSGLEGVTLGMLSTQDSLEVVQRTGGERRTAAGQMSMPPPSTITALNAAPGSKLSAADSAVFHRVGRAAKKHSLDEEFFVGTDLRAAASGYAPQQHSTSPKGPRDKSGGNFHQDSDTVDSVGPQPASQPSKSSGRSHHHHQPHHHSSSLTTSGRSSLTIGSTSGTSSSGSSGTSGRSCSLSDEAHTVAVEQRRRLQALSSSTSHATISSSVASSIAQSSSLSHSLPATIPNLEENKVKIQVPGFQHQQVHQQQQQQPTAARTHSAVFKQTSLDKDDR